METYEMATRRQVLARLQEAQTHIMYCCKCGEYGHKLTRQSNNMNSWAYWTHQDCGGPILISKTTTHSMFDNLTLEQELKLQTEIADEVSSLEASNKEYDICLLQRVRNELERRNRGSRNPLLPDSVYKRSLLHDPTGVPYCPQCDSLLVQPIRAKKRLFSVGLFGMASDTVGKSMECLSCKYKW